MFGVAALPFVAHRVLAMRRDVVSAPPYLDGVRPPEHAFSRFHPRWYAISPVFGMDCCSCVRRRW
jgi:hypothetical protein